MSRPPRLGRGLASLLGPAQDESTPSGRAVPIDTLSPGPFQPRGPIVADTLADLTASIAANGVLQPLLVRPHPARPGTYQIIAGERRWRASLAAGLHEVPVLVRDLPDHEALAAALVENLQRVDLNAIEEAEGFRRLIDEFAMTHDALATAVGKSRSHISNTLRLLNLPHAVQVELRRGAISAGHARALLAHPDPERAALQVIAGDLSVRATEALASRRTREPPDRDPDTDHLAKQLTEAIGLKVTIDRTERGGSVRIAFRSLDQLDGLVRLLTPG